MPIYKAAYLAPPLAKRGGGVEYLLAVGGCKLHVYTLGETSASRIVSMRKTFGPIHIMKLSEL